MRGLASGYLLAHLVLESAERTPGAPAVRSGGRTLTYGELVDAAARVAGALRAMGVGRGDRVALYAEKSVEVLAALYGTMWAGAAYVPIDPKSPPARAAYIAGNCEVAAAVTDTARLAALRQEEPKAVQRAITLDGAAAGCDTWADVQSGTPDPSPAGGADTDLAYVLYTSGSTGRPKGVMISHRNSLTFVNWARDRLGLGPEDVFSNHAPLHFDLSTLDLFGAAAAGGLVSVVPPAEAMFPLRLAEWIAAERISVWYSVPSALSLLVRYGRLEERPFPDLRLLLFAGEVFPTKFLSRLVELVPGARFFNLYGPTETNVCTYHEVQGRPAPDDPPVPIGRACENTRCHVVGDDGERLDAVGEEGELFVEGSCVAQGYWGDPERTAQGFCAPHTYRTGDVVEILEAGDAPAFRFVGRRDHMVKSRGYRIELGEIEAALSAVDGLEEAAAVAVPDELLGNRIAAYCAFSRERPAGEPERTCRERLPSYMVPDWVEVLDALPRTSNGKIDRAGLARRAVEDDAGHGGKRGRHG